MADPTGNNPDTHITDTPKTEPPATAVTPAAPAAKPAPKPTAAKPAAAKAPAKAAPDRRLMVFSGLFTWMTLAWTTFSLSMLGMVLGTVRFLFPNVLSEPPTSFKAGYVANFEEGVVTDRFKDQNAWVIRARDDRGRDTIYALSTTCTHLGCTPNWLENEKKFKCPCHGSGFKLSGVNFEGPAPRPLERWAVRRTEDGQVLVDKSRKFQREMGQWDDPDSFLLLG